jgi:hypothetical protein
VHRPPLSVTAIHNGRSGARLAPGLIGHAVGLFALTNIDDDLDLNCASQPGCARSTRDQPLACLITASTSYE